MITINDQADNHMVSNHSRANLETEVKAQLIEAIRLARELDDELLGYFLSMALLHLEEADS